MWLRVFSYGPALADVQAFAAYSTSYWSTLSLTSAVATKAFKSTVYVLEYVAILDYLLLLQFFLIPLN